jgi:hypothetical protein
MRLKTLFVGLLGLDFFRHPSTTPRLSPWTWRWSPLLDDAPRARQHMQKCALQRLRARSPTWRSGGPTGRWRGHARATATATSPHHHPHAPSIARPHHLIRSTSNLARTSSNNLTTDLQRIRAQRSPDPPQSNQNHSGPSQDSQGARGPFGLKQTTPPTGLSTPKSPLPCRTTPDVARRVARPRS